MTINSNRKTVDLIDIQKIVEMIPHRYPMLMIDKVIDIVLGQSAIGIKNVTSSKKIFIGCNIFYSYCRLT
jgi:3-hydroxyacyl-[acyl-carrier-protein] dehydratase